MPSNNEVKAEGAWLFGCTRGTSQGIWRNISIGVVLTWTLPNINERLSRRTGCKDAGAIKRDMKFCSKYIESETHKLRQYHWPAVCAWASPTMLVISESEANDRLNVGLFSGDL